MGIEDQVERDNSNRLFCWTVYAKTFKALSYFPTKFPTPPTYRHANLLYLP